MKYIRILFIGPFAITYAIALYGLVFGPPLLMIMVFAFQCFTYLMEGYWEPISLLQFIAIIDYSYYERPKSWIGVWEIANKVPFTLVLLALSFYTVSKFEAAHAEVKLLKEKFIS